MGVGMGVVVVGVGVGWRNKSYYSKACRRL